MYSSQEKQAATIEVPAKLNEIIHNSDLNEVSLGDGSMNLTRKLSFLEFSLSMRAELNNHPQSIVKINLSQTKLISKDIPALARILQRCPDCSYLDLSLNNIDLEGVKLLFELLQNTKIAILNLTRQNSLTSISTLTSYLQKTPLAKIYLDSNNSGAEFGDFLITLSQIKRPIEVILSGTTFTPDIARETLFSVQKVSNHLNVAAPDAPFTNKRKLVFEKESEQKRGKLRFSEKRQAPLKTDDITQQNEHRLIRNFLDCASLFPKERRGKILQMIARELNSQPPKIELKDPRFRNDERTHMIYPSSYFDNRFLSHSINQLPSAYFVAQGPENEVAFNFFLSEIVSNPHAQFTEIIVIGNPCQGEEYFNYFSKDGTYGQYQLSVKKEKPINSHIKEYVLNITEKNDGQSSDPIASRNVSVFHLDTRILDKYFLFNDQVVSFLYNLCLNEHPEKILVHCDTGINYSPAIIFSLHLFRNFTQFFSGTNVEIVQKILKEIAEFQKINTAFLSKNDFVEIALRLFFMYLEYHAVLLAGNRIKPFCLHEIVPIKNIVLIGSDQKLYSLTTELNDLGMRSILISTDPKDYFDSSMLTLDEKILKKMTLNKICIKLKKLLSGGSHLNVVYFEGKDIPPIHIHALMEELPDSLPKIYFVTEVSPIITTLLGKQVVVLQNNTILSAMIAGMATQVPKEMLSEQCIKKTAFLIGDQHAQKLDCFSWGEESFKSLGQKCYRLSQRKKDFEDIAFFMHRGSVEIVFEITSKKILDAAENESFSYPATLINKKCKYILIAALFDYECTDEGSYTPLGSDELDKVLKAFTRRAHDLFQRFDVEVVVPVQGLSRFDESGNKAQIALKKIHAELGAILKVYQIKHSIEARDFFSEVMKIYYPQTPQEKPLLLPPGTVDLTKVLGFLKKENAKLAVRDSDSFALSNNKN